MHKRWSIICNVRSLYRSNLGEGGATGGRVRFPYFSGAPLWSILYYLYLSRHVGSIFFLKKTISNVLIIGSYLELSTKVACQKNGTNFANYYVPRIGPLAKIWAPLPRTYGHIFWTHFFNLYDGLLRPGLKTRNRVQVVTSYSTTIFNITKKKFHIYNDNTKNQTFDMNMFTICLRVVVALSFK